MSRPQAPSSAAFSVAILLLSIVPAWADPLALRVTRAEVGYDQRTGEPVVSMAFDEASKRLFADFTARNFGKAMEIRVDGRAISKPVIREPILGGTGQIAGGFTAAQAREMAERLSTGAAKLEVEVPAN
jgi:preprotein translocase subunit SecD